MLQKVELRADATQIRPTKTAPAISPDHETEHDDGLLRVAIPIMVSAYGVAIGIAALTFIGSGETYLSLGICVAYMAMYFGIPLVMVRIRRVRDPRWQPIASAPPTKYVEVFSGTIRRIEALMQIVIVPLGVAFAFAAFAIIWTSI